MQKVAVVFGECNSILITFIIIYGERVGKGGLATASTVATFGIAIQFINNQPGL